MKQKSKGWEKAMKGIKGISIISIFSAFLVINAAADTVRKGPYTFTVSQGVKTTRQVMIQDSQSPCRSFDREIEFIREQKINFSEIESFVTELEAAFGVNLSTGNTEVKSEARYIIKRKLLKEKGDTRVARVTIKIKLDKLKCYDQEAVAFYNVTKYDIQGEKEIDYWFDKGFRFSLEIETFSHLMKVYTYNENCCSTCKILNKEKAVVSLDDQPLRVALKDGNMEVYILPLFWDGDHKIINPYSLLPEGVVISSSSLFNESNGINDIIAGSGSDGQLSSPAGYYRDSLYSLRPGR